MIDQMLMKMKNRRPVILGTVLAVGLLLGWNVVLKPGLTGISSASAELSGLAQKEPSFHQIANSEKKLAEYKQKISAEGDKTWLIEQLNLIAEKAKFPILSITPAEKRPAPGGYLDVISVDIEAEGNFHQMGEFVSRVESLEQFVKISSVDIDRTLPVGEPSKAVSGSYKILISVSLFSQIPGAL